jgi:hypothetical protein
MLKAEQTTITQKTTMEKLIINCETKEEWLKVLDKWFEMGKRWPDGDKEIKESYWDNYGKETCVNTLYNSLLYSPINYYERYYPLVQIISAEEFLETNQPANEKISCRKIMNKITAKIKNIFNENYQKQYKAGLIDECGDLTEKGKEELEMLIRKEAEEKLTARAEEIIAEEK